MWYKRSEAQKRFSFFFSSTTLAGAFGGLLASGLGKMDGIRGYGGWRWVFIIEGVITSVVAIIWFFVIPGFPEDVKWLNEEERAYIRAKLAQDVGKAGSDAHIGLHDVLAVFKDCEYSMIPIISHSCTLTAAIDKIFIGGCMYFGQVVTAYGGLDCSSSSRESNEKYRLTSPGYAYFAPTIIKTYGYGGMYSSHLNTLHAKALFQPSKPSCTRFHHGQLHLRFR